VSGKPLMEMQGMQALKKAFVEGFAKSTEA
jgi:hypothetical protein